jgi:glycerophosphoryl diester phosphodiesterase
MPYMAGPGTIPTLAEVLDAVSGQVPILLEIKDQDGALGADIGKLEASVARAAEGYDGDLAVMSFNPHSIWEMKRLCPEIPRGLVTDDFATADWPVPAPTLDRLREIPDFDHVEACFISHKAADLDRPRVADLKNEGASILCWTIKSAEAASSALDVAHNITFEGYDPDS